MGPLFSNLVAERYNIHGFCIYNSPNLPAVLMIMICLLVFNMPFTCTMAFEKIPLQSFPRKNNNFTQ